MAAKASAKTSKKESVAAPSAAKHSKQKLAVAAAVEPPPRPRSIEERWASLEERLGQAYPDFQRKYQ